MQSSGISMLSRLAILAVLPAFITWGAAGCSPDDPDSDTPIEQDGGDDRVCGDGIVDADLGEECDDGANNSDTTPDACREDCHLASCGDSVVDTGEECDAGPEGSAECTPQCEAITANPCIPNPCTTAPHAICDEDGLTRIMYVAPGVCRVKNDEATCTFRETTYDCSTDGKFCWEGTCVTTATPTADWCRLQSPLDLTVLEGTGVTIHGLLYEEDLTDQTTGVDTAPELVAQAGYGPDRSNPVDNGDWVWTEATPDAGQKDYLADSDPYQATFTAPAAGSYDYAFRFSLNSGYTWVYCDRNAGPSADGSENGYQPANAGNLISLADPCSPNPCTDPPADTCAPDGVTRIAYAAEGTCFLEMGMPVCDYSESATDCSATGQVCLDGACQDPATP